MPYCNICGCREMEDNNKRKGVRCVKCKSLERHRLVRFTIEETGWLSEEKTRNAHLLHLAPEACTASYLSESFGAGYTPCDREPASYPHVKCLKINLPDDFRIWPNDYFDLIIHNHVLEHIPGDYHAHLVEFHRILKKNGQMIFTLPPFWKGKTTRQGGELMSPEQRMAVFGQHDHLKYFGLDFFEIFDCLRCDFRVMDIPDNIYKELVGKDQVFIYIKK